jgi:hypothetical protein
MSPLASADRTSASGMSLPRLTRNSNGLLASSGVCEVVMMLAIANSYHFFTVNVMPMTKYPSRLRNAPAPWNVSVDHVHLPLRVEHFSDLPRACLSVPSAAGMDEFASIGSNDMTSLAVEPTNACPRGHPRSHSRLCTVAAPVAARQNVPPNRHLLAPDQRVVTR